MTKPKRSRTILPDQAAAAPDLLPWQQRPLLSLDLAAALLGSSRGKLYALAANGHIQILRHPLLGRSVVCTSDVLRLLNGMKPLVSGTSPRGQARVKQLAAAAKANQT